VDKLSDFIEALNNRLQASQTRLGTIICDAQEHYLVQMDLYSDSLPNCAYVIGFICVIIYMYMV